MVPLKEWARKPPGQAIFSDDTVFGKGKPQKIGRNDMGIFKKLINKVLDAEVPPVVEKLVKKELAKNGGGNVPDTSPFSMKIEDVFSIPGRGTVVSGKIDAGSIKLNDEITLIGESQKKITKVVSIEKSNKLVTEAKIGGMLWGLYWPDHRRIPGLLAMP
jgi:hypothetical protein